MKLPLVHKYDDGKYLWTVVVKDDLQFGLYREERSKKNRCLRYCATVKALRRDWRALTGQEIPTDPDPFLGCATIKEYLALTGVLDKLEGK